MIHKAALIIIFLYLKHIKTMMESPESRKVKHLIRSFYRLNQEKLNT